jgi:ATP-dependent Zn protease
VACLPVPRANKVFSSFLLFAWWPMLLFLVSTFFTCKYHSASGGWNRNSNFKFLDDQIPTATMPSLTGTSTVYTYLACVLRI